MANWNQPPGVPPPGPPPGGYGGPPPGGYGAPPPGGYGAPPPNPYGPPMGPPMGMAPMPYAPPMTDGSFGLGFCAGFFGGCIGLIRVLAIAKGPQTKKGAGIGFCIQMVIGGVLRAMSH